jgi:uncharacterized protein (TIRG00374 family)
VPSERELAAHVDEHAREDEEWAGPRVTRRALVVGVVFVLFALGFLYWVLPQLTGLEDTWHRVEDGNPWWLALAFVFTVLSFGGYVLLFEGVYVRAGSRIDKGSAYLITMAGLAATRVLAAGGAGGIALTAWALRRAGMRRRQVADSTVAFLSLQYIVYMLALIVCGFGLRFGLFPGTAPFGVTVLPAVLGIVAIAVFLLLTLVPSNVERRARDWACRHDHPRMARIGQRIATVPATVSAGAREAIRHIRSRDPALLGALAFWGFNIGVLWAAFEAFGDSPPWAVLVMGYFVGMLGNLLPLPGGVGGVDGGMIGAFAAFGVDFGLATVAVLTYRFFAFWLPTLPGAIAYFQLRRRVHQWDTEPQTRLGTATAPCYYTK